MPLFPLPLHEQATFDMLKFSKIASLRGYKQRKRINMFIHFLFNLCPLRLAMMLNFNISKVAYLSSLSTEREKKLTSGCHF